MDKELTPMMRQYLDIKSNHQDAILFFRLGDFYEMFFEDAQVAAKELDLVLTSRDKREKNPVPLCGIPHHASQNYIHKLVSKGYKVAICEQVEDPALAKGIVKREVVQVVTPGVQTDAQNLAPKCNNYLVSLALVMQPQKYWGIAYVDISTGEFKTSQFVDDPASFSLQEQLLRLEPQEIVLSNQLSDQWKATLKEWLPHVAITEWSNDFYHINQCERQLKEQFQVQSLDGFGISDKSAIILAAGAALAYLQSTQKRQLHHLEKIQFIPYDKFLHLDDATTRNLELFYNLRNGQEEGTLKEIIDYTNTAMGGRRLREWMNHPLQNLQSINERLDAVNWLKENHTQRHSLRELLKHIVDINRIMGKVALGSCHAKDLVNLKVSLNYLPDIKQNLIENHSRYLTQLKDELPLFAELIQLLDNALNESPPISIKEGGIIRSGFSKELDELRNLAHRGKQYISQLEATERNSTGINSLKVRYNKVFGYYIEVTKANLSLVPPHYLRKQTLANAERYITPELKEYEEKVLHAQERMEQIESQLFYQLRMATMQYTSQLHLSAHHISILDCLAGLAELAAKYNYCRPEIVTTPVLNIHQGRHPVLEQIQSNERFVPNDIALDPKRQLLIITGPNMAGKSTVMRQTALITYMAHLGSFVPASAAQIGLTDRIFTRVGATDFLARGQSTFMVEMLETANILNHATSRSLVILDEIGRGTSTYDGLSIAWAVAEYIHDQINARTLFATHYHELTELAASKARIFNMSIAVKEWQEQIIFLRKLTEGSASRSYGIQVARLAGFPQTVLSKAKKILANLEQNGYNKSHMEPSKHRIETPQQENLFESPGSKLVQRILDEMSELNIEQTTPMDALQTLYRWKKDHSP